MEASNYRMEILFSDAEKAMNFSSFPSSLSFFCFFLSHPLSASFPPWLQTGKKRGTPGPQVDRFYWWLFAFQLLTTPCHISMSSTCQYLVYNDCVKTILTVSQVKQIILSPNILSWKTLVGKLLSFEIWILNPGWDVSICQIQRKLSLTRWSNSKGLPNNDLSIRDAIFRIISIKACTLKWSYC